MDKKKAHLPQMAEAGPAVSRDSTAMLLARHAPGALLLCHEHGDPRVDSRILAAHMGNEHKHVRELIEKYRSHFERFGVLLFETAKPLPGTAGGRPERFALLNEDQAYFQLTLVRNTPLVVDLKARLVLAFREARNGRAAAPQLPNFDDPAAAARAWANEYDQKRQLQLTVQRQAVDVAALEQISASDGSMCVTDAAKTLKLPPRKLFTWLEANAWTYRRGGPQIAHQEAIKRGWLEHAETRIPLNDGSTKVVSQVRVRPKGLTKLATLLGQTNSGAA
ncbi:phage antirepressor KilAC domain-containing protein [Cupriavidus sp. CuC1]|uniref:phage antirepressor KilAC domain-containing protein n=1 Tax=Cupriavidus sp. CuC1 TaxID=3373131 RepID=UPI0037CCEFF1